MDLAALDRVLDDVGDRWSLLLVAALDGAAATFADLEGRVQGISPTVLSSRLKDLVASGHLEAVAYQHRPARYRYALTARGAALVPAVRVLAHLGGDAVTHEACGTPAEPAWWCPTCEVAVVGDELGLVEL